MLSKYDPPEKPVMTEAYRMEIIQRFLEKRCFPILVRKGKSSSGGSADPNAGFDLAAEPTEGIDRYHVWWIYASKQIFRLKAWVFKRQSAEPLGEVMADVINYALIAVSMMVQDGYIDLDEAPMLADESDDDDPWVN